MFRYNEYTKAGTGFRYNYYVTIGYAFFLYVFDRIYNAYLLGYSRIRVLVFSQFLSQLLSVSIIWVGVSVAWRHFDNPLIFLGLLLVQLVLNVVWSYFASLYYFKLVKSKRTVLIYRNELDRRRFGSIKGKPSERLFNIVVVDLLN